MTDIAHEPATTAYAGVGSRRTPRDILRAIADLAQALGTDGCALATGGADGADDAFVTGALRTDGPITVHAPWPGYNGYRPGREAASDIDVVVPGPDDLLDDRRYADLARRHHPAWSRCGRGARALFVRNVSILAGARCGQATVRPSFVVGYTANGSAHGRDAGGTGHTLRLAAELEIPVVNLSPATPPAHNAAALRRIARPAVGHIVRHFPRLPR